MKFLAKNMRNLIKNPGEAQPISTGSCENKFIKSLKRHKICSIGHGS